MIRCCLAHDTVLSDAWYSDVWCMIQCCLAYDTVLSDTWHCTGECIMQWWCLNLDRHHLRNCLNHWIRPANQGINLNKHLWRLACDMRCIRWCPVYLVYDTVMFGVCHSDVWCIVQWCLVYLVYDTVMSGVWHCDVWCMMQWCLVYYTVMFGVWHCDVWCI